MIPPQYATLLASFFPGTDVKVRNQLKRWHLLFTSPPSRVRLTGTAKTRSTTVSRLTPVSRRPFTSLCPSAQVMSGSRHRRMNAVRIRKETRGADWGPDWGAGWGAAVTVAVGRGGC